WSRPWSRTRAWRGRAHSPRSRRRPDVGHGAMLLEWGLARPPPSHAVHWDGIESLGERDHPGVLAGELAYVLESRQRREGKAGIDLGGHRDGFDARRPVDV